MSLHISVSANHKYIDQILEKAKALKLNAKDELSWDDGFKYSDKSRRNIVTMDHSEAMWKFLLELEPTVEDTKRKRVNNGSLTMPTSEEVVKYGYKEPK